MLSSKDVNFVGYTYKNFEIVPDSEVPGVGKFLFSVVELPSILHSISQLCMQNVSTPFLIIFLSLLRTGK
jgi:hypothetical protein